ISAIGQSPDAFTGTWKLNSGKSSGPYRSGTRTYQPRPGGTYVTYSMTHDDGTTRVGEYTTECHAGKSTSEQAIWIRKSARTVEGQIFENGKPAERYLRSVSVDGRTMTITFYPATGKKKVISVQVFDKL